MKYNLYKWLGRMRKAVNWTRGSSISSSSYTISCGSTLIMRSDFSTLPGECGGVVRTVYGFENRNLKNGGSDEAATGEDAQLPTRLGLRRLPTKGIKIGR